MKRALTALFALLAGCSNSDSPPPDDRVYLDKAALMDPTTCTKCHAKHVEEWSGSMHAYAAVDPIFVAMNARAQRETSGAVGTFCVQCHAPVAVREGLTKDGLNLDVLPAAVKGVTCYFCHSVDDVEGDHNNPLHLATDGLMRGAIANPAAASPHRAGYSGLHDRNALDSAKLCGACHDVANTHDAHLERTFAEWQGSLFSKKDKGLTCNQCHMDERTGLAAEVSGVGLRQVHAHTFPGVDVALTPFPGADVQRAGVQALLDSTVQTALCVVDHPAGATVQVVLDNVGAGHAWPSGSSQDRRAWVEVVAYANELPIYQSGIVKDSEAAVAHADADMWLLRDCMFDEADQPTDLFWQAKTIDPLALPAPTTLDQQDPAFYATHVYRTFPRKTSTPARLSTFPDRVTMRVRIRPIDYDVVDSLVASNDLDEAVRAKVPTFELGLAKVEWTPAAATIQYFDKDGIPVTCVSGGLAGGKTAVAAPEHTRCGP